MATIFIVDDQLTSRMVLEKLSSTLEEASLIRTFADPVEALRHARSETPDLVLADYKMPGMDGVEFTGHFRSIPECFDVPLVVVTSVDSRRVRYRALEAGATDFLTKPVDIHEFRARCHNMLTMRAQQKLLKDKAAWLEQRVAEATRAVQLREHETLLRLAKAGEYRDEDTGLHVVRMARYCRIIARNLGLSESECALVERSAPMHDIGKIGISDAILMKRGPLSPEEFRVLKSHTTIGYEILKGSPSKYLKTGAVIALAHHERFDGGGYPGGLAGEEIPLPARIVAVADVYDALTTSRPYKAPWGPEEAVRVLERERGRHFDPGCVDAFCENLDEVMAVAAEAGGGTGPMREALAGGAVPRAARPATPPRKVKRGRVTQLSLDELVRPGGKG
ncbi:MAG: two-component system response regulator [Deferrisomatales bacterium]